MTTTHLAAPRLRASDADRAATATTLQDAVGRGLLTPEEGGERLAAAFAAVHRDELPALTADLPTDEAPAGPSAAVGWRALVALLVAQVRAELAATRAAGVRSRRFAVAVVVVVLLTGLVVLAAVSGHGFPGGDGPFPGGRR